MKELDAQSRIVVVGTSGSGKSTFARRLAERVGSRDVELDALHWGPDWTPHPDFRARTSAALSPPGGWIVHGNYAQVQDLTLGRATHVVWLDYPRAVVMWRVFKRSMRRSLTREVLYGGNRETLRKAFLSRDSILWWAWRTFSLRRRQYGELARDPVFAHLAFIRFGTPREAEAFLA